MKPTVYCVTVAGKAFEVHVLDGARGTLAGVAPSPARGKAAPPELAPATLTPRNGPVHALVRDGCQSVASVARGLLEGQWEVQLPGGRTLACTVEDEHDRLAHSAVHAHGGPKGPRTVTSIMPGIIVSVAVEPGSVVAVKGTLLVIEAMKMQNEVRAEVAGVVTKVHVKKGQSVAAGAPLLEIAPPADA